MDPITIGAIATAAWQGYVGNRVDTWAGKGFTAISTVIKRIRQNGQLPPNHDLFKALRISMLDATSYLVSDNVIPDSLNDDWIVFGKESIKWINNEKKNINDYISPEEDNSPEYAEVEKMLLGANVNGEMVYLRNQLAEKVKQNWLNEWRNGIAMDIHPLVEKLIIEGWQEQGKAMDWFDITALLFAELLKDKNHSEAKDAFQNRLLAEIKTESGITSGKIDDIAFLLRNQIVHYDFIKNQLVNHGILLQRIEGKIDVQSEQLVGQGISLQRIEGKIDNQEKLLMQLSRDIGMPVKTLMNDEGLFDLLEKIERLEKEVVEIYNEKEEARKEFETNPQNKFIVKAYNATLKDWEETARQLQESKVNFESIKNAYIRQKEVFDRIDWTSASERLKKAKNLFYEGSGIEAVDNALLYDKREVDIQKLFKAKEQIANVSRNFAEEELILALNRLKDIDDRNRFVKAKAHFEKSIEIYPAYNNYSDFAHFLAIQNDHTAAIKNYEKALAHSEPHELENPAILLNNLGILYCRVQRYKEAENSYGEAMSICRKLTEKNPEAFEPAMALTLNNLGILYCGVQRYSEAENRYDEALTIRRKLAEKDPDAFESDVASTLNQLGLLFMDIQRYDDAEKSFDEALSICHKLAEKNPDAFEPDVASTLIHLGILHRNIQRYGEVEKSYDEALTIYRKLAEKNPDAFEPDVAMTLNNFGILYGDIQRYSEAESSYVAALSIRRKLAEKNPDAFEPDVAMTLNNLGVLYSDIQRFDEVENSYNEALSIRRKLAQKNPDAFEPEVASTLNNLGNLYNGIHRYREAEISYSEALSIRRKLAEKNPDAFEPEVATTLTNLGVLYCVIQRYGDAENSYSEALFIRRKLAEKNPDAFEPAKARTLNNLGILYNDIQRYDEAENKYSEALPILRKLAEKNPDAFGPDVAMTLSNLGVLYYNIQRYDEAEKSYTEVLQIYLKEYPKNRNFFFWKIIDISFTLTKILIVQNKKEKVMNCMMPAIMLLYRYRSVSKFEEPFKKINELLKQAGTSLDEAFQKAEKAINGRNKIE